MEYTIQTDLKDSIPVTVTYEYEPDEPESPGYVVVESVVLAGHEISDLLDEGVLAAFEDRLYWMHNGQS
jgi:hypothetical protein